MSTETELVKALRRFADVGNPKMGVVCTVSDINTTDWTCKCTPVNGDAVLVDVRLMSTATNGFLIVPSDGSIVVVTYINENSSYVSMFSDIDEIYLNGDTYDGLVKVNDLVTKLNNLENKVNTIITTYNAHTHVETGGTTAIPGVLVTGSLTPTVKADLENTTVKHGNGT